MVAIKARASVMWLILLSCVALSSACQAPSAARTPLADLQLSGLESRLRDEVMRLDLVNCARGPQSCRTQSLASLDSALRLVADHIEDPWLDDANVLYWIDDSLIQDGYSSESPPWVYEVLAAVGLEGSEGECLPETLEQSMVWIPQLEITLAHHAACMLKRGRDREAEEAVGKLVDLGLWFCGSGGGVAFMGGAYILYWPVMDIAWSASGVDGFGSMIGRAYARRSDRVLSLLACNTGVVEEAMLGVLWAVRGFDPPELGTLTLLPEGFRAAIRDLGDVADYSVLVEGIAEFATAWDEVVGGQSFVGPGDPVAVIDLLDSSSSSPIALMFAHTVLDWEESRRETLARVGAFMSIGDAVPHDPACGGGFEIVRSTDAGIQDISCSIVGSSATISVPD